MTHEHIFSKAYSTETNKYFRTIFYKCIDILKVHNVAICIVKRTENINISFQRTKQLLDDVNMNQSIG